MKGNFTRAKTRGQGRSEYPFVRLNAHLQPALRKDGDEGIPVPILRDRAQGKVDGLKVFCVEGNPVLDEVDFATLGWGKTDIFAKEKGNGQGVFGDELHGKIVCKGDICKPFERRNDAEIRAADI